VSRGLLTNDLKSSIRPGTRRSDAEIDVGHQWVSSRPEAMRTNFSVVRWRSSVARHSSARLGCMVRLER
jgi:hypothetical protein